jgi:hypothetical protein
MSDYRIEAATKEEWANRAKTAEAKLAKAVEAMRFAKPFIGTRARAVLAELEGKE